MDLVIEGALYPAGDRAVPVVLTRPAPAERGERAAVPTVLLLHGLGAHKEVQQKEASSLARAGLFVVTVDAPHHGARRSGLLDEIMAATGTAAHAIFLRVLREAIAEIPLLVDHLAREGHGPFGVAGISMGAYCALGAAAVDPRLAAVVSILGSPDWSHPSGQVDDAVRPLLEEAPARRLERFPPRALFLANAGRDTSVPPHGARAFAEALRPLYAAWPDRLSYKEYPESSHFMREVDWNDLWSRSIEWLRTYLDPAGPFVTSSERPS
jgi:dienelactone hydrolase